MLINVLETMLKHGTVDLLKDVVRDLNRSVWANTNEELVVRAMVDSAESKTVWNNGMPVCVRVIDDVCRIQQSPPTQLADCASIAVGRKDAGAEYFLVNSSLGRRSDVVPNV